jgi:glutathione reductase (NADPH)
VPPKSYDAIVIGTGVAGQTAAEELAEAGLRVAAVDRREVGGTCSLRGCEPKKVLVSAAEVVERAAGQCMRGVRGLVGVDWPELVAFKRSFTDPAPKRITAAIEAAGATVIAGEARFTGPDTLEIGGVPYSAEHFVIATGARPAELEVPGAELAIDSESFMDSEQLPDRVVFVGGGYIGFEFAHVAASTGAQVTIVHRSHTPLGGFDPDLVAMLVRGYRMRGIEVVLDAPVSAIHRTDAPAGAPDALEVVSGDGTVLPAGMVVAATGRLPDLDALDLAAGGVTFGPRGIETDATMRSVSNPRVWAAGDAAASGPPLTPVGVRQARVLVQGILGKHAVFDASVVPSVVFADPPLVSLGLSEAEARARDIDVDVRLTDSSQWLSALRTGTRVSAAKVLLEPGTGRILGAHLLGHNAEEVVNVFAAAMLGGLTAEQIKAAMWAYPTASSEIVYLL